MSTTTSTQSTQSPDATPEEIEAFTMKFVGDLAAVAHGATVVLGDKLGLYKALAASGPSTSEELASATGYDGRHLREWLLAQAASGYANDDPATTRFSLDGAQVACLADDTASTFLAGGMAVVSSMHRDEDGSSTILMAQASPASEPVGFDYHAPSIDVARTRAAEAGLDDRVRFEVASAADYPGDGFGLVCVFDALHDMGNRTAAAAHIRRSLADDGTFLLVEPNAHDCVEDNLNLIGRIFYSASTFVCTPASRSQGGTDAACLGAQAGEAALRAVLTDGGFSTVRRATETPFNMVLDARP